MPGYLLHFRILTGEIKMWLCPLCGEGLNSNSAPWRCSNGHSFDMSRRGYVNLLPVHKKASKAPGDNKSMISARRCFHANCGFAPLMDRIAQLAVSLAPEGDVMLYDAGCGEGAYLAFVREAMVSTRRSVKAAGSDISKVAIDFAAKQVTAAQFVVASSFDLPVASDTADIILQIFAPGDDTELCRILRNDGTVIHVAPGENHLLSLKQVAYDIPRPHALPPDRRNGLKLLSRERLQFTLELVSVEHAMALINMTPFTWRFSEAQKQSLAQELNEAEGDFVISVWKKADK